VLLAAASLERHKAVLRTAIEQLLDDPAFAVKHPATAQRQPVPDRRPRHSAAQRTRAAPSSGSRRAELRPRMRAPAQRGTTEQEIADGNRIALSTLRRLLSRVKREPTQALIARTTAWLDARERAASQAAPGEETDRLSPEQRDRLAFFLQHDAEGVRRAASVSRDVIDQTASGGLLDRAVIARLSEYLTAG
jgi:hypothetical protein